ncbi:MAG: NAD(P)H-dependent oxidoreductase [Lachnospiraceae bacterium]|nr:NAD(P)H-dependent oxidoreductase [Lachnospiraceae bacterium]
MGKALVAYFSASGVTKKVSEKLAKAIGADLFEIVPEMPYTKDDLNWMDKKSRSSVEMNDRACRPAIAAKVEDMAQYDVVFIGFPVWWYREPSIIDTFAEAYDFGGKTIIPFATSGGSGLGESAMNIGALAKDAHVIEGKRFAESVSEEELQGWAGAFLNA